mgnify:CR=1 FL=1
MSTLIDASKRGVRVRVISDDEQSERRGSDVQALAKAGKELMAGRNGSLLTLSYLGAMRTLPNYNVMGVAKAALVAADVAMKAPQGAGTPATTVPSLLWKVLVDPVGITETKREAIPKEKGRTCYCVVSAKGDTSPLT